MGSFQAAYLLILDTNDSLGCAGGAREMLEVYDQLQVESMIDDSAAHLEYGADFSAGV